MKRFLLLLSLTITFLNVKSQTIIMNEVSNGPSGNQEYVEFVVVSNTVTYNCNNSAPPCIDIRGWIFDDNSGLHGGTSGTGVASGAIRFSQDAIWSCIPLGTIILIYNNLDRNPAIPPDDINMADGNCTIIAPVNSPNLFETNATTPGAVACSYPSSGWTAVGSWTTTLLANSGDCARIVNLSGCEVFSVCYGTANTNNLIYYAGGGGQKVFYFNDTDPAIQANWTSGSASPSPGNQTPGAPNNAANAAYIAQFNNGCMPIVPISIGTPTVANSTGCVCTGSASVNASGSLAPYTYEWFDSATGLPIGQTASTATALCAGVYSVVATSRVGCEDTVLVTITASSAPSVTINNQTICSGNSTTLTATPSAAGGTYSWSPGGQTTQTISVSPSNTTTYVVTYSLSGCAITNSAVVTVNASPAITVSSSSPSICASGQTATLSLSGSSGTYLWSNGANTSSTSITSPGVYTATVTTPSCGTAVSSITVAAIPFPTVSISVPTSTVCTGSSLTFTANSSFGNYLWTGGATTQTISVNTSSIVVTTTNVCGSAQATQTISIVPIPTISVNNANVNLCTGQSATVTATSNATTYTWSSGSINTNSIVLNTAGIYTVTTNNLCGNASTTVDVVVTSVPTVSLASSSSSICASGQTATLTLSGSSGTYTWSNGGSASTNTVNTPGVYTATVTTPSCGSATTSITIGTSPLPTVSISVPSTTVCSGSSLTFTANSSSGNYLWSNGATTNTISINSPSISVTSTNACGSSQATQTLNIISLPTVTLSTNAVSLCSGQSATVQSNANTSVTYTWSTGVNTSSVSLNSAGVFSCNISNACGNASESVTVTVGALPSTTASATQTLLCSGQTTTLSTSGIGNYLWSNGATTQTTTVSNSGVYSVTLTNSCGSAVSSVSISSQVTPTVSISASSSTICAGQTSTIIASSNVNNYSWSTGSFTNTTLVNTSGIVTLTVSNSCGVATASTIVFSNTLPVLNLSSSSPTICPNETATLTVTGGSSPYSWSNTSNTGSVVTTNGGTITVSNTNSCGTTTATVIVNVTNLNADVIANPTSGVLPLVVSFTNNSSNANSYAWNFGNGNSATTSTVSSETYSVAGTYTVYLIATNGSCSDIDSLIIEVLNQEGSLLIPNVFTPNGDSINDVFRVSGFNIIDFNCTIFDRWGLQMFSWDGIKNGWNGKSNDKEVPAGTYFYMINAKDIDSKEIKKQGAFSLFR